MRIVSADLTHSSKVLLFTTNAKNVSDFNPGMYVACIYDKDWHIGIFSEISVEFDEMRVSNLWKLKGEASYGPKKMINVGFQFLIAWDLKHWMFKDSMHGHTISE